jgi:hypothetical protein
LTRVRAALRIALAFAVVGFIAMSARMLMGEGGSAQPTERSVGPLGEYPAQYVSVAFSADHGRVNDFDPIVELRNPFDVGLRITDVVSIPYPDSPAPIEIVTYYLVGPGRKVNSITGGILTAKDYGVPLIPADDAVVPPGAKPNDYRLMVRVRLPRDAAWARNDGFAVTYEADGHIYVGKWYHSVSFCSPRELGAKFCDRVGTEAVDVPDEGR